MTDPFYRAEPDDAPEDASIRYSVIAGILYLVIVAVVAFDCWAQVGSGSNDRQQPARIRFGSNPSKSLTGVGADYYHQCRVIADRNTHRFDSFQVMICLPDDEGSRTYFTLGQLGWVG